MQGIGASTAKEETKKTCINMQLEHEKPKEPNTNSKIIESFSQQ